MGSLMLYILQGNSEVDDYSLSKVLWDIQVMICIVFTVVERRGEGYFP